MNIEIFKFRKPLWLSILTASILTLFMLLMFFSEFNFLYVLLFVGVLMLAIIFAKSVQYFSIGRAEFDSQGVTILVKNQNRRFSYSNSKIKIILVDQKYGLKTYSKALSKFIYLNIFNKLSHKDLDCLVVNNSDVFYFKTYGSEGYEEMKSYFKTNLETFSNVSIVTYNWKKRNQLFTPQD